MSSVTVCSSTKYENRAKWDEDIRQFRGLRIGEEVDIKIGGIYNSDKFIHIWSHGVVSDIKKYSVLIIFDDKLRKKCYLVTNCMIVPCDQIYLKRSIKSLYKEIPFAPLDKQFHDEAKIENEQHRDDEKKNEEVNDPSSSSSKGKISKQSGCAYDTDKEMLVDVTALNGNRGKVKVDKNATVKDVKFILEHKEGIPAEQLRLIYKGKLLCDSDKLEDKGYKSGERMFSAIMHVVHDRDKP